MKPLRMDNPVIRLTRHHQEDLVFLGTQLAECSDCWCTHEPEQLILTLYRTSVGKYVLASRFLSWKTDVVHDMHRALCFASLDDVQLYLDTEGSLFGSPGDLLMAEALSGERYLIEALAS